MKKFFRRALTAIFIVACVLSAAIVSAAIQTFDGEGRYIMSDFETEDIAKQRAIQRAKENAQDKAGVYLTSFSKMENARLTSDEISAVTNNIIDISDVQVNSKPFEVDGEPGIIYTVTLKAKIDPEGIWDFVKRDEKDKVTIVQQNTQFQDAIAKNDKQVEDLKEQYKRATSQVERDRIREQMNDADRDFLANQKLEEGFRLYYAQNYDGAMKICNEVIQYHPNFAWAAYSERGLIYFGLKQYKKAVSDFSKTIKLKPNWTYISAIYVGRASAYALLNEHIRAFADFSSAININPNLSEAYIGRGVIYAKDLNRPDLAMEDFDKAIQINPNSSEAYIGRGIIYMDVLKQYTLAIIEFNNAIKSNPNSLEAYISRCVAYAYMKNFKQAVDDATKAIQINPNYATAYHFRGLCHLGLRDKEKAQADFDKAKQLGYNG